MTFIHRIRLVIASLVLSIPSLCFGGTSEGKEAMVVTSNPYATRAALSILGQGGNAIDAAIAAQMVLNVVEPFSTGIGGGGFLLYYDGASRKMAAYDGRETAPAKAYSTMFLKKDGSLMPFGKAAGSGLAVGTPGLLAMVGKAHSEHGKLAWGQLLRPAIDRATKGYTPIGSKKVETNLPLAATFKKIQQEGVSAFYNGDIADQIVHAVANRQDGTAGWLSHDDLAKYEVKERQVLCAPYHKYNVCGVTPPSTGAVTLLQSLKILERFPLQEMKPMSAGAIHLIAEANKLAYADRNKYIADPDFVEVPVAELLSPDYIATRVAMISSDKAMDRAVAGVIGDNNQAVIEQDEPPSTTHISVVDKDGNAVSLTSSIQHGNAKTISAAGFNLNNQLSDFSFNPETNGQMIANRIAPGKRARSSMSPSFVFNEQGNLVLVLGSPGGAKIIPYLLQTIIAVVDWGMDINAAIALPQMVSMGSGLELEAKKDWDKQLISSLAGLGHKIEFQSSSSGLNAIQRTANGWVGSSDPRELGLAGGM